MTRTTAISAVGLAGVVLIVSSCLKGPQEPDGGWPSDLGVPTLVSPTNGSSTTDQTPAFDWSDVSGATKYRIQVDNNSNFGSPEINQEVTSSTYTPTGDLALGAYYWRVCAGNAAGWGSYATSWGVTIADQSTPLDMVPLSGGTFLMGSDYLGTGSDEMPTHSVSITAFSIAKYEVTQAEYQDVMGINPSYFQGTNRPVETVTWWEAAKFCNALSAREGLTKFYNDDDLNNQASTLRMTWDADGYRLPTEAEWEYACRAGSTTEYYWGDTMDEQYCWYWDNYSGGTKDVGTRQPNAFGLYDMSGNAWEWCNDRFSPTYYQESPSQDPKGSTTGSNRVVRGGCYFSNAQDCRSANRYYSSPGNTYTYLGFRPARR